MTDSQPAESSGCPSVTADELDEEQSEHRAFLLRNIEFLIDTIAAEQRQRQWLLPCGCPRSTPVALARQRRSTENQSFPCCYADVSVSPDDTADGTCACDDPLCGSDDPLDALIAVVITETDSPMEHYFARGERAVVAALRDRIGEWDKIASCPVSRVQEVSEDAFGGRVLDRATVDELQNALAKVGDHHYTDGISLADLSSVAYSHLVEMFAALPNVEESDAWWFLLTALDKPVWPTDERIDRLLVDLGLMTIDEISGDGRNRVLEERLSDRRLPALHRALAGHARYCGETHTETDCELQQFALSYRLHEQATRDVDSGPTVVDLFCGAGGLSHGFTRGVSAPAFDVALAVDQDQEATDTYRLNHPKVPHRHVRCEDIGTLVESPEELAGMTAEVDVVVGGPPCQALSVAGFRSRRADDESYSVLEDPRTSLYRQYVSLLETLEPECIIMENVEGIRSPTGDDDRRVIDDVQGALSGIGYTSGHRLLDCSEFGIPQNRDRVILFGVRNDSVTDPDETVETFFETLSDDSDGSRTLRQALSNLPRLRRGEGGDVIPERHPGRASRYVRTNALSGGTRLTYNHRAREHPMEKDRKLFSDVMEPGDTGWDIKYGTEYGHLIEYNVGTEEEPAFKDKYRMLRWDEPAPTIVAHLQKDANSFILPDYYEYAQPDESKQDGRRSRGITPREAARVQSFPDSYVFLGSFTGQFRQIGNAVPPLLGEELASVVARYVDNAENVTSVDSPQARIANSDD